MEPMVSRALGGVDALQTCDGRMNGPVAPRAALARRKRRREMEGEVREVVIPELSRALSKSASFNRRSGGRQTAALFPAVALRWHLGLRLSPESRYGIFVYPLA